MEIEDKRKDRIFIYNCLFPKNYEGNKSLVSKKFTENILLILKPELFFIQENLQKVQILCSKYIKQDVLSELWQGCLNSFQSEKLTDCHPVRIDKFETTGTSKQFSITIKKMIK